MAISLEEVESISTEFARRYPSLGELRIEIVEGTIGEAHGITDPEHPANTAAAAYYPRSQGSTERGTISVSVANAVDAEDVRRSLRHEAFGHHGLNTFTTAEKRAVLDGLIHAREDAALAGVWRIGEEQEPAASRDYQAEEVWSLMAEYIPEARLSAADQRRSQEVLRQIRENPERPITGEQAAQMVRAVAWGMQTGELRQQHFPETPQSLFRKDSLMSEANAAPAGEPSGEQDDAVLNVGKATRKALALPPHMAKAFYPVGSRYYHQSNTTEHYFEVSANKLTASRTQSTEKMATMLVDVAAHNKWKSIEVTGTQGFRRETWHRASLAGIAVSGYEPDEHDLARLARARAAEQAPSNAPAPAPEPENAIRNATADTTELAQGSAGENAAERGPAASTERRERMASIAAMAGAAAASEASEGNKPDQQEVSAKRERVLRTNTERARAELSQSDRNDLDAAVAFEEMKPSVATKSHPRLAGPYAVMGAYRASLKEQGVPEKERRAAEATMRDRLAERIRQGHYDAIKTEQVRFPGRETTERESRVQTQELTPSL